ncbi:MAG: STAS domain-containing protein [Rubrobacteraceae bacterium]
MNHESPPFATLAHERGGVPVVKVSGELDLLTASRFRSILGETISGFSQRTRPSVLVLDLSGVEFMDSCGVNALVAETRGFVSGGGEVRLVAKTSPVMRTLEITGLDGIFEVYPDVASASWWGVA